MSIRDQRAFGAGAFLLMIALCFFAVSFRYPAGTAAAMGPGYLPRAVSGILGLIGCLVMLGATRPGADAVVAERWDFVGLGWIIGAVLLFALLLRPTGLVASLFVLVMLSSKASAEFNLRGALATSAILILVCVVGFVRGLGLLLPLWPEGWN